MSNVHIAITEEIYKSASLTVYETITFRLIFKRNPDVLALHDFIDSNKA